MALPDRLESLLAQDKVTAIDFIYVWPNQTQLDVFFLVDPTTLTTPLNVAPNDVKVSHLRIFSPSGGEMLPEVPITGILWASNDGRNVLRITTETPGDFSRYRLVINDPLLRIDPYPHLAEPDETHEDGQPDEPGYRRDEFSFKANCPSELDCKARPHECPPEVPVDFPVDYSARDFWSFRRALLDFATQRYPDWKDRLEADLGIMLIEVMSAVGDEFAYIQDRIGREAFLETAAERRSLRRHARLVDYDLDDGLGASTWLDFTVDTVSAVGNIPKGAQVFERNKRVVFEVGHGLHDLALNFNVRASRNQFVPHIWDEDDTCLLVGSTTLYIKGHHQADLPFDDPPSTPTGKWVLLKTIPTNPAILARTHMVRLIEITDMNDPVFNQQITKLRWEEVQAVPFEMDLETLVIRGNLVPATAGETFRAQFRIGATIAPTDPPEAVERTGPEGSVQFLFSLPKSNELGVVWMKTGETLRRPEVRLHEATKMGNTWVLGQEWSWRRSFVGVNSSQPTDLHFTLDDGFWHPIVRYQRLGKEIVHVDYAMGTGLTVRFGDGGFGTIPASNTLFQVTYRLGNGRVGNVTADTLTGFDPVALPFITAVTNPFLAGDGTDSETSLQVRRQAPEAFRAVTFRAVRPEDYAEAAERLPWVDHAGAAFRWTGSWLTAFATPDPRGATKVTRHQYKELVEQLDRFRQTGREAYVLDPVYANLDLEIGICVEASSYRGEVKEHVLEALFGRKGLRPTSGFFSPDHFTFGTPLERSELEAVIQGVAGVRAVETIKIRRRGWFAQRLFSELTYRPGANEIIRAENNPLLPERGSVKLVMVGGA